MKPAKIAILLILLFASAAQAEWTSLGNGLWQDETWVYRASYNRWNCRWDYVKVERRVPNSTDDQFDIKIVDYLKWRNGKDRNERILNKLGIDSAPVGYATAGGYRSYGRNSYTQGYIPSVFGGGGSVVAQAAYPLRAPLLDPTPLLQEQQRQLSRTETLNFQTRAGLKDSVDRYTDAAKIQAATQAYASGFANVVQSAQQVRTEVNETWTEPQANGGQQQPVRAFANPHQDSTGDVLSMLADNVINNRCATCHGNVKHAGGHDFLSENLSDLWGKMKARIHLPISDPKHMPPEKQLADSEIEVLQLKYGGGQQSNVQSESPAESPADTSSPPPMPQPGTDY